MSSAAESIRSTGPSNNVGSRLPWMPRSGQRGHAWSRDGDCGVTFDPALDEDDLRELQRKFALARGLTPNVKAALDDWTAGMAR